MKDYYYTISKATAPTLYKEKGSKFIGYAFPIQREEEVKQFLSALKEEHHKARHWCYAFKLGAQSRASDDGEPNNSAGQPIYGQILSADLDRVLLVVVRYFGGTKLGVGGLVTAYKTAAQLSIASAVVIKKTIDEELKLQFEYAAMDKVLRVLNDFKATIVHRKMELDCEFVIQIRESLVADLKKGLEQTRLVRILDQEG